MKCRNSHHRQILFLSGFNDCYVLLEMATANRSYSLNIQLFKWMFNHYQFPEARSTNSDIILVNKTFPNHHFLLFGTTPNSAPNNINTWLTLSIRNMGFPCSISRTTRSPTPALAAKSSWVRFSDFLFFFKYCDSIKYTLSGLCLCGVL